jgi:acyl-CoA synthetase (AMP-forming)/AMP-acid ligase II
MSETGRDLWNRRVRATPDRPFLRWRGRSWTFGECDESVRRVASGLAALGVGPGVRVLVGMSNRAETVQVQLALQQLGAVHVPLLGGLTFEELAYQVDHSEGTILVADDPVAATLLPGLGRCRGVERVVLAADASWAEAPAGASALEDLLAHDPARLPSVGAYEDTSLLAILYTSGSTGKPKAVMLPAGAFHSCGEAFAARYGIRAEDNFILPVPLAHATGALTAQSIALHTGCRLTVVDRFSPSELWDQVRESGATVSILFPAHLNLLLELEAGAPPAGATTLRLVITHSANERFRERFGVELAMVWGMTETGAMCVGTSPGESGDVGVVGTPMLGVDVRVVDDELRPLPPGTAGEICLRHRHVMLGYLKDPEATDATLVDGWIRSGDLGVLDGSGRLRFAGRLKNVIKRSGENISGEEVEAALDAHPAVVESIVFGVPDRLRSEEVGAVVVVRPGARLDAAELVGTLKGRLARWKLPRYVVLRTESLPRLGNGKIDRTGARRLLDRGQAWDRERAFPSARRP